MVPDVAEQGSLPSLAGQSPRAGAALDLENVPMPPAMFSPLGDLASEERWLLVIQSIAGLIVIGGWIAVMRARKHSPQTLFKVYAFLPPVLLLCASVVSFFYFSSTPPAFFLVTEGEELPFSGSTGDGVAAGPPDSSVLLGFPRSRAPWDSWCLVFRRFVGSNYAAVATLGLLVQALLCLWRILTVLSSCPDSVPLSEDLAQPALPSRAEATPSSAPAALPGGKKKGSKRRGGGARESEVVGAPLLYLVCGRPKSSFLPDEHESPFTSSSWSRAPSAWSPESFPSFLLVHPSAWLCLYTATLIPLQLLPDYPSVFLHFCEALWMLLLLLRHSLSRDKTRFSLQIEDADPSFSSQARSVPALGASDFFFLGMQALQWFLLRPMINVVSTSAPRPGSASTHSAVAALSSQADPRRHSCFSSLFSSLCRRRSRDEPETHAQRAAHRSASRERLPSPTSHSAFLTSSTALVIPVPSRSGGVQGLKHVGPPLFVDADGDEAHEFFHVGIDDEVTHVGTQTMRQAAHARVVTEVSSAPTCS
ncbi:conserved hypothetical protein [Neospora caninum Liverpool]|uniref:Transmembrane protein n=1 Tax=Neospora caninum (strain Liverpool) TaxID=572307 RepID=F0VEX6_NEOCL|nr:conserved hypothetical protein [Neospora caninum Liverpool]CBZ52270.1 conserved hypothetical protein [Neospora caninum Liverpool]|eukprot:XP_003882302.1 conserved hypothetical protein [Neospora caninum Liverpool]